MAVLLLHIHYTNNSSPTKLCEARQLLIIDALEFYMVSLFMVIRIGE